MEEKQSAFDKFADMDIEEPEFDEGPDTTPFDAERAEKLARAKPTSPFDRLPVTYFGAPPKGSLYHTKRAREARDRARSILPPEHLDKAKVALEGRAFRAGKYADSADHNVMTLAYAYHYADLEIPILDGGGFFNDGTPCGHADAPKVPRGAGWQGRGTTDHDQLTAYWRGEGEYPPDKKGAVHPVAGPHLPRNICFIVPKGYMVVDLDGARGDAEFKRLIAENGELPKTWTSISGSGGRHYVFKTTKDIRNTASAMADKIDIRGVGGQIVVEPSLHKTAGFYRWEDGLAPWECEVAQAPEWLENLAFEATKSNSKKKTGSKKTGTRKGNNGRKPKGQTGLGFEGYLESIGDHQGGTGFDTPIYSAACSWFGTRGPDADAAELFEILRLRICKAVRDPVRDRSKYDTDEYLDNRIKKAREFIKENADEGEQAEIREVADETKTPEERAATFTTKSPESDIRKFLKKLSRDGVDKTTRANVTAAIVKVTNLGKREIKAIWKDVERANNGKTGRAQGIYLDEGSFRERCDLCATVMTDQGDSPSIFHSNGRIAEIGTDEHGELKIENIDPNRYKARMEDRIDFHTESGSVEAPKGVVNNVYHRDKTAYPPLHRIIRAPTYAPDKSLITEPGYHPSGVFYQPQVGVVVPRVSAHPTKEEVRAAVDKLIDPFADFRFDAMTREELVSAVKEGKPVPSLCHTLSVALTPLCRSFIDGPTPGHLARKMKPRTGATKLLSAVSYIATLSYARPQSLPDQKAEVQKTIVASFDSGQPFIFFDNLPDSGKVDFGELASGMTAWPYYTGRRLGVTGMVDAANKATWLFTGNRTALSEELALRTLLIVLDPQTEHPEYRTDFKYDIDSHVVAHGGEYLHCLLTIVQHWVSEGCKEWSGRPLGGFERHSKIIGGILESAGIMGFLGNREVLCSTANVASPEDEMMDAMIEMHHATPERKAGTLFRVWGADAPPQYEGSGKDRSKHYYAAHRVVSIKETLEAESIALSKTGYAQTENGGVIYPDKSKAALVQRIANMVGAVRELGADREEEEKKQGRYIFEKVFSDKHSVLYGLKQLPLKAA